jgi:hypothetical protein
LFILPDFRLGAWALIIVAVLALFCACFLVYRDLLKVKEGFEAKLKAFDTLNNQLTRLYNEGNLLDTQIQTGFSSDKNIEIWYKAIHELFEKSLPSHVPQLERMWQYYQDYPIIAGKVKKFQEFIRDIQGTITPDSTKK